MKTQRKVRRAKRVKLNSSVRMGVLITILTIIVIISALLMIPGFNINEIYCEGNVNLSTEEIIKTTEIQTGKNILMANIGKARRNVENISMVEKATVRRVFPNKICVSVTERIPAGYFVKNEKCVVVALDKMVIENIEAENSHKIKEMLLPSDYEEAAEDDRGENNTNEGANKEEPQQEETVEKSEEATEEQQEEITEELKYKIPIIVGVEIKKSDVNKNIEGEDKQKLEKVFELCNALEKSRLLGRTTFIDVTNLSDIRLIIENRLDIFIGDTNNIEYRTSFLAEIIKTKITAYEKAIMDYRGDDIYVRPPDDGKDRIIKEEKDEKEEITEEPDEELEEEPIENMEI